MNNEAPTIKELVDHLEKKDTRLGTIGNSKFTCEGCKESLYNEDMANTEDWDGIYCLPCAKSIRAEEVDRMETLDQGERGEY